MPETPEEDSPTPEEWKVEVRQHEPNWEARIEQYVFSNLGKVFWGVALLIGLSIHAIYFGSIQFMPEIGWSALTSFLLVSALTGATFTISLCMLFFAPSFLWKKFAAHDEKLKPFWVKRSKKTISSDLAYFASLFVHTIHKLKSFWKSSDDEPATDAVKSSCFEEPKEISESGYKSAANWFALPIALGWVVIFTFAFVCPSTQPKWAFSASFIPVFLSSIFVACGNEDARLKSAGAYLIYAIPSFLLSLLALSPALAFARETSTTKPIVSFVLTIAYLLLFSYLYIVRDNWGLTEGALASLALLLFFFSAYGIPDFIPRGVMRAYRLGDVENASLVLDKAGCAVVKEHKLTKQDSSKTDARGANSATVDPTKTEASPADFCSIKASIESRLGETYFLKRKIPEKDTTISFTIPDAHVLSWSVRDSTSAE